MANKKSKGKDPTGSQSLPKYKGKKGGNVGERGRRARSLQGIRRSSNVSRLRAGGTLHPLDLDPNPGTEGVNPRRSRMQKSTGKGYVEAIRRHGLNPTAERVDRRYKPTLKQRTGGSKHNSGLTKKHTKNPKR